MTDATDPFVAEICKRIDRLNIVGRTIQADGLCWALELYTRLGCSVESKPKEVKSAAIKAATKKAETQIYQAKVDEESQPFWDGVKQGGKEYDDLPSWKKGEPVEDAPDTFLKELTFLPVGYSIGVRDLYARFSCITNEEHVRRCATVADEAVKRETTVLRDCVRGFLWLLNKQVLIRDITRDSGTDYAIRTIKLTMFFKSAYELSNYAEVCKDE